MQRVSSGTDQRAWRQLPHDVPVLSERSGRAAHCGDTSTFADDAVGNLTRADNADAHVRRAYTLNGQVAIDTLAVRSYATPSFTTTVFLTTYGYDRNGRRK